HTSTFDAPTTPDISTLSLHDALPISHRPWLRSSPSRNPPIPAKRSTNRNESEGNCLATSPLLTENGCIATTRNASLMNHRRKLADRKSTRLNSSHVSISYAVFCLKKK